MTRQGYTVYTIHYPVMQLFRKTVPLTQYDDRTPTAEVRKYNHCHLLSHLPFAHLLALDHSGQLLTGLHYRLVHVHVAADDEDEREQIGD